MSLRTEHINYINGQQKVAQSCRDLDILINTHTPMRQVTGSCFITNRHYHLE